MTITPDLDARLADYLAARDRERTGRVAAVLSVMTARERTLVREAVVMAYVTGMRRADPASRQEPPADAAMVYEVVAVALAMPDLYPTLARLERKARRTRPTQQQEEEEHR